MEPFRFADSSGKQWYIYDFRLVQGRRRAVPVADSRAEARAFVPSEGGSVLVYKFGLVSYHTTERKLVEDHLRYAKPLDASDGIA
jgi:hypothetical protein